MNPAGHGVAQELLLAPPRAAGDHAGEPRCRAGAQPHRRRAGPALPPRLHDRLSYDTNTIGAMNERLGDCAYSQIARVARSMGAGELATSCSRRRGGRRSCCTSATTARTRAPAAPAPRPLASCRLGLYRPHVGARRRRRGGRQGAVRLCDRGPRGRPREPVDRRGHHRASFAKEARKPEALPCLENGAAPSSGRRSTTSSLNWCDPSLTLYILVTLRLKDAGPRFQ